jgi:hypothetical protein
MIDESAEGAANRDSSSKDREFQMLQRSTLCLSYSRTFLALSKSFDKFKGAMPQG